MTVMSRIAGVGEQDNWLDSQPFRLRMTVMGEDKTNMLNKKSG